MVGKKGFPLAAVIVAACVLESVRSALVAHYYLLTVVTFDTSGSSLTCTIYDDVTSAQRDSHLASLTAAGYTGTAVDFATILQDIDNCTQSAPGKVDSTKNGFSVFAAIKPGTRWCGSGDKADSFDNLGKESQVDRCCRGHDFCPIYISSKTTKYGLYNSNSFTMSHCDCDTHFKNCLKKVGTSKADNTGKTLFDVLKASCVQFKSGTNSTGGCSLDDYNCQVANITLVQQSPVSYKNSRWIWRGYYYAPFNF
ncbi:unnamed protein product [Darwinula stevensoni]|uniref:Phospholipase A2-like central domain-containing protein n=1 Tax=Darwinula stevensoni TaxID=69355 RepID=A0A7R9AGW9_9CRUS|nr:unnamed protein product [Darwinula stevensoni]CAG0904281.1 unnamed protein product [Darwinula stevensoni]